MVWLYHDNAIPLTRSHKVCLYVQLAEVPGAASVNLQPAEHIFFYKEFSKMSPSAFSILGPPGPEGRGQTWTKTFLGQVGMCVQNIIKISAGVWISVKPPHTNRPTNICTPIFIYIEDR